MNELLDTRKLNRTLALDFVFLGQLKLTQLEMLKQKYGEVFKFEVNLVFELEHLNISETQI